MCCIIALSLLLLPACNASSTKSEEPIKSIKVGVSVYDHFDTFVSLIMDVFNHYSKQKSEDTDISFVVLRESAGGSQISQNNQVESFIGQKCDVICVNLVDRTDASVIIEKTAAANIPVIFFNRELVEQDLQRSDNLYYIGADAEQSGIIQGQLAADLCESNFSIVDKNNDGIVQYVMLEGEAGHQDAIVRTDFSIKTLEQSGFTTERLEDEIANWSIAQAETKMSHWLAIHGNSIEIVFANNDDMALGAIYALQNSSLSQELWPLVFGIDGTPIGLQSIIDGYMTGSVLNDGEGQGRALFELAFSVVTGTPLPNDIELKDGKYIRFPYQPITAENAQEYLDRYSLVASRD